jgi:hypothetical protein
MQSKNNFETNTDDEEKNPFSFKTFINQTSSVSSTTISSNSASSPLEFNLKNNKTTRTSSQLSSKSMKNKDECSHDNDDNLSKLNSSIPTKSSSNPFSFKNFLKTDSPSSTNNILSPTSSLPSPPPFDLNMHSENNLEAMASPPQFLDDSILLNTDVV